MIWHSTSSEEVLEKLEVSKDLGLSSGIAVARLEKYGENTIKNVEKPSVKKQFLVQLKDKYAFILFAIAIITSAVCLINGEKFLPPLLIILIVVINALISAIQMYKSQVALNRLRSIASPTATVIRDGNERQIPAQELVPGDIIIIKAGDVIPADARLVETTNFSCNEAILTGSDVPVNKNADLIFEDICEVSERNNMAFSGTVATLGVAKAVVVETGLYTELGRSSSIDQQTGEYTLPIQSRLNLTGKIVNISIFIACILVFIINVIINFRNGNFAVMTTRSLLDAMALAVAAIPEGLPAISVLAVALGIERIIKDDIIIKKVSALEVLGKTTVICADKTGIITKNKMSVDRIFDGKDTLKLDGEIPNRIKSILQYAVACSTLENDSTENSIEAACRQYTGIDSKELGNLFPRVAIIPFDPARKTMTSINMKDGKAIAIVKGAPENLADKLNNIDSKTLLEVNESMALDALRVVCIAVKPLNEIPINPVAEEIEKDLTFIGLIGLDDPPRLQTIEAINVCDTAGIRTVMITGDNPTTAKAVARRVGIFKDGTKLLTGSELAELSDEELVSDIGKYSIFARVSPEDKLRIIDALQKSGETVTVTGDNFTDVQALANADIGCAMGKIGADVARGNADIIIKNSHFDSVVNAIKESRGLFANIQKAVAFLLSCNIAEVLMYFISLILFKRPIVTASQLLLINLLTDCAPVIALATGKAEEKVMQKCPVSIKGRLFDNRSIIDISLQAAYLTAISIFAFVIGKSVFTRNDFTYGTTMAFAVIALAEIFHAFNIRFTETVVTKEFKIKDFLFISSVAMLLVILLFTVTPLGSIFGMKHLAFVHFIWALIIAITVIPFCELLKFLKKVVYK